MGRGIEFDDSANARGPHFVTLFWKGNFPSLCGFFQKLFPCYNDKTKRKEGDHGKFIQSRRAARRCRFHSLGFQRHRRAVHSAGAGHISGVADILPPLRCRIAPPSYFPSDGEGHCFRLEKFSRKAAAHHLRMPRHAGDAVLLLRLHQGQQRGGRDGSRIHHAGPHHHVVLHA